jgi:hypothetical protein
MDTPPTGAIIATGNTIATTGIRSIAAHGWYRDDLERGKSFRLALTHGNAPSPPLALSFP